MIFRVLSPRYIITAHDLLPALALLRGLDVRDVVVTVAVGMNDRTLGEQKADAAHQPIHWHGVGLAGLRRGRDEFVAHAIARRRAIVVADLHGTAAIDIF